MRSCLYEGRLRHRRFSPVEHAFEYTLFMVHLDLDELPDVLARYPGWSNDGWGVARFRRRDHLKNCAPADADLQTAVRELVERETGHRPAGRIELLTHLEYFGYRFNPVSFYFCYDATGARVEAVIAEINNTPWGEQHCYVLHRGAGNGEQGTAPGDLRAAGHDPRKLRFEFAKQFHISPFMGMDTTYRWFFTEPGATLAVHMDNRRGSVKYFDATMMLRRTEFSRGAALRVLVQYPLMTAKVIGGIYWQALRLWMKRCPYFPHPRTPAAATESTP